MKAPALHFFLTAKAAGNRTSKDRAMHFHPGRSLKSFNFQWIPEDNRP
ncbi:MAG: hypothetical protein LBG98_02790 [Puniceicoccales bacterium]|nr:hypothetical protein [Puniceicoccales bacterium]